MWYDTQMMIHRELVSRRNDQCRRRHEPIVLSNTLSIFIMHSGNEYEKLITKERKNSIFSTSTRISHSTILACIFKYATERTLPTKRCLIWFTMFVVESFYNLKVRLVNIWVSGKGIIWRSLLTRDVSISIKSMTTKALLFTVHYKVYSNYVFKSVYKLYKKLNRDGV
jgi:hypothetical protein